LDVPPPPVARRLAAIDIGSNSVRLLVAEAHADGTYRILDDEKRTTRLAHGLAQDGRLHPGAIEQSVEALAHMKAIADGYAVERSSVIATSAVREASNRDEFLLRVRQRLGLDIQVISGIDEGELSFASAVRHFDLKGSNAVVVDLGGGSAELIFAAQGVIEAIYSLPIGAVRLTEAYVATDPLSEDEFRRLKKRIRKCVVASVGEPVFVPHVMIGAGGTFLALANMSMRRRGKGPGPAGGYELDRGEVRHILDHLRGLPLRERRAVPGLNADRADIIVAGLTVIDRLMKLLRVNRLLINDQGVRDGVLLRLIAQVFPPAARPGENDADALAGVRQFAAACSADQHHPEHVTRLAGQLFEQLRAPLGLPTEERLVLEAAGLLHEVGYLINYERHHQHSYHLILHGNLRGLSSRQRELVANVARYHRGSTPKRKHDNFARLTPADQDTVRRLSALLRLAGALDRTHTQAVQGIRCERRGDEIVLTALADQEPEVDLWSAREDGKYFEKVFGVRLKTKWARLTAD
jgi:exopolyphosphatase/guanosine-5'-triphosphate,3'-diphosphate pyrophosphatase